jgi:hypothetical protein
LINPQAECIDVTGRQAPFEVLREMELQHWIQAMREAGAGAYDMVSRLGPEVFDDITGLISAKEEFDAGLEAGGLKGGAEAVVLFGAEALDPNRKGRLFSKLGEKFSKIWDALRRTAKSTPDVPKDITISRSRFPESAQHIDDAVAGGQPSVLTVDRAGAAARRKEALSGTSTRPGMDRDEFPPAMFEEGGRGSSVRHINPSDNRGAGACIGGQCRGVADGDQIRIIVVD